MTFWLRVPRAVSPSRRTTTASSSRCRSSGRSFCGGALRAGGWFSAPLRGRDRQHGAVLCPLPVSARRTSRGRARYHGQPGDRRGSCRSRPERSRPRSGISRSCCPILSAARSSRSAPRAPAGCSSHQPSRAILLLLFPVAFFAFIVNTVPASRYLNPVIPFVALLAAWMLRRLALMFRAPPAAFAIAVAPARSRR